MDIVRLNFRPKIKKEVTKHHGDWYDECQEKVVRPIFLQFNFGVVGSGWLIVTISLSSLFVKYLSNALSNMEMVMAAVWYGCPLKYAVAME